MTEQDPRQAPAPKSDKPPFVPVWLRRARDGALYGYGADGKPVGKDMSGGAR